MDANVLGNDVHAINVLTVIASESYDSFAKGLQTELADAVTDRPQKVTASLFEGKVITDARGNEQLVDADTAQAISSTIPPTSVILPRSWIPTRMLPSM